MPQWLTKAVWSGLGIVGENGDAPAELLYWFPAGTRNLFPLVFDNETLLYFDENSNPGRLPLVKPADSLATDSLSD